METSPQLGSKLLRRGLRLRGHLGKNFFLPDGILPVSLRTSATKLAKNVHSADAHDTEHCQHVRLEFHLRWSKIAHDTDSVWKRRHKQSVLSKHSAPSGVDEDGPR